MDRKKFLRMAGLRAVTGVLAFGGFCYLISPYATVPFRTEDVIKIVLAGAVYSMAINLVVALPIRFVAIFLLALAVNRQVPAPTLFWVFVPMILVGFSSALLMPYPKKQPQAPVL